MRTRSAESLLGLNDLTNWLMGYLARALFVEVIMPRVTVLRHRVMFFMLFGWMFHAKMKDGELVAIWFVNEIRKIQREEEDAIYYEKVE